LGNWGCPEEVVLKPTPSPEFGGKNCPTEGWPRRSVLKSPLKTGKKVRTNLREERKFALSIGRPNKKG